MAKKTYPPNRAHPRYWGAWLGIGLMRAGAMLPWRLKLALGRGIGLLTWKLAKRRRHITDTNLALCFPELDDRQRAALVRKTFIANGIGILETATGWCRDPEHLRHRVTFKG
ncbi:MAG: lipid A biosynthesis acyltransferase, partial [Pseudomonadota bacterium]|nr:lipid A biosynthesis acyltransferase [Pseudomonadota bacterium]